MLRAATLPGGPNPVLVEGADAVQLLGDKEFLEAWAELEADCPWGTVFQGPAFFHAWWSTYSDRYQPLVFYAVTRDQLTFLWVLVRHIETGRLAAPGEYQAEYHGWLARDATGLEFLELAVDRLRQAHPRPPVIRFDFWLPGAPFPHRTRVRYTTVENPRGIVDLTRPDPAFQSSLRKSSTRSKFKRLVRNGPVTSRAVADPREFELLLATVAACCDLRQGAFHGIEPFRFDPRKLEFHRRLFEVGLLQVFAMWAGTELVAAHLGLATRKCLHLGLLAHTPTFGRLSPGKLLLLLLEQDLHRRGYETFDLTPGGDYKERFADRREPCVSVAIHLSKRSYARAMAGDWARTILRRVPLRGISARSLAVGHRMVQSMSLRRLFPRQTPALAPEILLPEALEGSSASQTSIQLWHLSAGNGRLQDEVSTPARDYLPDILAAGAPAVPERSRPAFLARVSSRLEAGQHCRTITRHGSLAACGWLQTGVQSAQLVPHIPVAFSRPVALLWEEPALGPVTTPEDLRSTILARVSDSRVEGPDIPVVACLAASQPHVREAYSACGFSQWKTLDRASAGVIGDLEPPQSLGTTFLP